MKTIEERASEYATRIWPDDRPKQVNSEYGFREGAQSERAELTRWNDPKKPPKEGVMVLVKRTPDSPLPYDLAHHDGTCWVDSWCGVIDLDDKIIGWREIHE